MSAEAKEKEKRRTSELFQAKDKKSNEEVNIKEAVKISSASTATILYGPSKEENISNIPEAVDDFVRNFLHRLGMTHTLNCFEVEWYSSAQMLLTQPLRLPPAPGALVISDAITHKQLLQSELQKVYKETNQFKREVLSAGDDLVRLQRDRDLHRLHCQRLVADKSRLTEDIRRLKERLASYEPVLKQLDDKYEVAVRQKMLLSLESERMQNTLNASQSQDKTLTKIERSTKKSATQWRSTARHPKDTELTVCSRPGIPHRTWQNPGEQKSPSSFSLLCSIKAHTLPISCISLHPGKKILASASDDCTWKLWALPASREKVGQMVLTGEGHSDWLSSCSFHPDGTKMATTSGDTTVRLWDFLCGRCVLTLSGHSQPTWGCSFHSCGHFLVSCSSDKTAKLWDLNSQRCRLTMRRHTASVNSVCFQSFSNTLLTSSADKTLALWDIRLGVCTASFTGHQHPCNHATFALAEEVIASCDSYGIVNIWDIRKPTSAVHTIDAGPMSGNQVAFSPSGRMVAIASSDSLVRLVNVDSSTISNLSGQGDSVQSVTFDHKGTTVMSAGSNGLINVWM
ncbi:sperm-associated antigen 16 protein [Syngnathoides biaculeatus]|uniref:sperm-associated antigen 16 protein n=1 Tax=Syngnathoides biaculeatus TaxID=300417 RepID=UPI002ADD9D6D|nr:sperm-associated antigen 16 protein [Syngnathoides biaculeatus]